MAHGDNTSRAQRGISPWGELEFKPPENEQTEGEICKIAHCHRDWTPFEIHAELSRHQKVDQAVVNWVLRKHKLSVFRSDHGGAWRSS